MSKTKILLSFHNGSIVEHHIICSLICYFYSTLNRLFIEEGQMWHIIPRFASYVVICTEMTTTQSVRSVRDCFS